MNSFRHSPLLLAAVLVTCGISAILPAVVVAETGVVVLLVAFLSTVVGWRVGADPIFDSAVVAVVPGKGLEGEEQEDCCGESA